MFEKRQVIALYENHIFHGGERMKEFPLTLTKGISSMMAYLQGDTRNPQTTLSHHNEHRGQKEETF